MTAGAFPLTTSGYRIKTGTRSNAPSAFFSLMNEQRSSRAPDAVFSAGATTGLGDTFGRSSSLRNAFRT